MKKGAKTRHSHLLQAKFLVNAASWVISQGLCQLPAISIAIFPKLSSHARTPALSWLQQSSPTTRTMFLPQHSWGWGKHHRCGAATTLHPCINAYMCCTTADTPHLRPQLCLPEGAMSLTQLGVRARFVSKLTRFLLSQSTWSSLPSILPHKWTSVYI